MRRKNREKVLDLITNDSICVEIGVWKGDFSQRILNKNPKKLILIDPWITQDYEGRFYFIEQHKMDIIYQNVCNKFNNNNRVKIVRSKSNEVALELKIDWIYIDGNHSYENVLEDLRHYYGKMNNISYMCGDDFGWTDKYCNRGPSRAVKDFCQEMNLEYKVFGDQFVIEIVK